MANGDLGGGSEFELTFQGIFTGNHNEVAVLNLVGICIDKPTVDYLTKAINNRLHELAQDAIKLAKDNAEQARLDAVEEAREVIGELTSYEEQFLPEIWPKDEPLPF
jgi:FixJ family two-component response regulator